MIALARWLLSALLPADVRAAVLDRARRRIRARDPAVARAGARRGLVLAAERRLDRAGARGCARRRRARMRLADAEAAAGPAVRRAAARAAEGLHRGGGGDAGARHRRQHRDLQRRRRRAAAPAAVSRSVAARAGLVRESARHPAQRRSRRADYFDWRDQARGFEALAAFGAADVTLTGAGDPVRVIGRDRRPRTSADTLGVRAAARPLAAARRDARRRRSRSSSSSERLWRERFGARAGHRRARDRRSTGVRGRSSASCRARSSSRPATSGVWLPLPDGWRDAAARRALPRRRRPAARRARPSTRGA